ncbi:MAG: hypothetical protein OWQ57_02325 [Sulfobacillus sp.]|nr:hypothetical protein [Sulfobacillus sp.]
MNESSRRWNRWAWPVLSLALFALSVSSRWFQAAAAADRQGCVNVHGLEYATIVQAGMIFGLAVGPAIIRWARQAARVLMPEADATRRQQRINAVAALSIVLGMLTDIFWVVPQFNVYIDLHRPLLAEADVVLYGMGFFAGAGWAILLERQAWIGWLISLAMALMVIGSVLSTHSWC